MKAVIRDVLETILLTLAIYWGVRLGVQNFRVEGYSMEPTLHSNQYLIVNKVSYLVGEPQRGDIVVFKFPRDPRRDFIKRIVAMPGETIEGRNRVVLINGQPLDEPYVRDQPFYSYPRRTVPPGEYFVLGDNRNNSHDSHVWDWLPREYVVGKAWLSYWPLRWWGVVTHDGANALGSRGPP